MSLATRLDRLPLSHVHVMFTVVLLIGAAAIAILGQETKRRSLEDIAV